MKKIIIILLLFLLLAVPCLAGDQVSVSLKLDRSEAALTDSIGMAVKVSGTRKIESEPVLKGLESFEVRKGGSSSSVRIINGKVESSVDYTYAIYPKKSGTFKIGPAEVTVKGKLIRSNEETLTVRKPSQATGVSRGPLFLSASLSEAKVYVEEQALYILRLYRQVGVRDISLELPKADHLVFTQLKKPVEYQGFYNGKTYQVLEVRYALIPLKEGTYGIRPARMGMTIIKEGRRFSRNPFDDDFFSFSSGRPKTVASEPLELTVVPLPKEGRPADFSGLVGTFQIHAKISPEEIKVGESATLMVLIKGRGNVKRMPDLKIPEPDRTKVYADQPVLEEARDPKGLAGAKTMKWALVPEKEGEYQIAPLAVSFFDIEIDEYRTISSPSLMLSVLPGEEEKPLVITTGQAGKGLGEPLKKEIKELGSDILPVHTSIDYPASPSTARAGGLIFWLLLLGPLLIYAGAFILLKFNRKSASSIAVQKSRKSAGAFYKKCREKEPTANDMISSVREYLNDRFGLLLGSLTAKDAGEIVRERGVSNATAGEFEGLVKRLEDAIYTGNGNEICNMGESLVKAVKQVEKEAR